LQDPLELLNRKRIYECIRNSPGLHFREIQRRTDLPIGVLEYHLNYLTSRGLLSLDKQENYSRYYPGGQLTQDKHRILSALRQEIPRGIILFLLRYPGATHGEVLKSFTISGGTLSYHTKKLISKKVLSVERVGRESHLTVIDPEKVADLLIVYRRTFFDRLVDDFVARYVGGSPQNETRREDSTTSPTEPE
jgi:predicted transcriptional regulator